MSGAEKFSGAAVETRRNCYPINGKTRKGGEFAAIPEDATQTRWSFRHR